MGMVNRTIATRFGIALAVVVLFATYVWWHSSKTWQYEEVIPGSLYRVSLREREDIANALNKCEPTTLYAIGNSDEQANELLDTAVRLGAKGKIRVHTLDIDPGREPSPKQVDLIISMCTAAKRRPVLLVGLDGERGGMVAAAVRLQLMKLPLDKVLELAALPDAPKQTTEAIRAFARNHAAVATTAPTTMPEGPVLPRP